jgi:4-amino-4-deoxy-L-arabinose transferase-like glycosyltransferase
VSQFQDQSKNKALPILWWALVALVVFRFISIGWYPLMDSTEARYGDVARRMVERHDWITLWFSDTEPFWGKPPLAFWASALGFVVMGVTEAGARLPQLLLTALAALLVYIQLKPLGRATVIYGLSLFWSALLLYMTSAAVTTDIALTLGTTAVLVAVWQLSHRGMSLRWNVVLVLGMTIGLLAKGPLVLVLCGVPVFVWAVWRRQLWYLLKQIHWPVFLGLTVVLTLPWYVLAERATPGFLHYFLVGEHWLRFVQTGWQGDKYGVAHAEPWGTIWWQAAIAWLPWSVLLPLLWGITRGAEADTTAQSESAQHDPLYWWVWGLWPCVFFTVAGNILWTYVLPGIPALAIALALWLRTLKTPKVEWCLTVGVLCSMTLLGVYIDQCRNRDYAVNKAAKLLVDDYKSHSKELLPLYFFGDFPFSGSFYTDGKAQQFFSWEQLPAKAYVVVSFTEDAIPPVPPFGTLQLVSQRGERHLYYWQAPAARP